MVSFLLITIMAISLVATTGYTAFTLVQSSDKVAQAQRSAGQMHKLAALVEANLRTLKNDGVLYPPAPKENADGSMELPAWLVPGMRTPWGAAYGYCVFAPAEDAVAERIVTAAWPQEGAAGARAYAIAAPAAPPEVARAGVLAAVLAPSIGSDKLPSCASLTMKDGLLSVPGGSVVAVTRGASADLAAIAAAATVRRHVAPEAMGDGSGTTPANAMTLTAALGLWQATQPATMVLRMVPGRHEVPAALLDQLAAGMGAGRAARVVLQGEGPGVVVGSNAAGASFRLPNDVRVENVGFETAVEAMPGTRVTFVGSNAIAVNGGPALKVSHAHLDVTGSLTLASGSGDGVQVAGGEALFRDADVVASVGTGRAALVSSLGAAVTFAAEKKRPRLHVRGRGGVPLAAIRSGGGQTILDRTDVATDGDTQFAVVLENGALELSATALGTPAARPKAAGVLDLGGARVAADANTQVTVAPGAKCGHGELFTQRIVRANWGCRQ
ncbi:hypothetical protein [Azospirillum soli]|uniref:hypothetical protein n=1 Tax=Azospirillum soli TaxID=1304799 RepID=UPI001AEB11EA|nr:hypothetical protein [Azospirillum soli]MBP2313982.1 hypothetical protein [Azospirillum soli]